PRRAAMARRTGRRPRSAPFPGREPSPPIARTWRGAARRSCRDLSLLLARWRRAQAWGRRDREDRADASEHCALRVGRRHSVARPFLDHVVEERAEAAAIAQLREECAERLERLFGLEVDRDFLLAANAAPLVRRHARQETVVLADKLALEVEPRKRNRLPGASEERRDPRHGGRIATGGEVRENVAGHFMIAD